MKKRNYAPETAGTLAGLRILNIFRLFAGNVLTQSMERFWGGRNPNRAARK